MAQTITTKINKGPHMGLPSLHVVEAALVTEPYTNGTGVHIDLASKRLHGTPGDIKFIFGKTNNGMGVVITHNPTAALPWRVTARLYVGTTEESTANKTVTITMLIMMFRPQIRQ